MQYVIVDNQNVNTDDVTVINTCIDCCGVQMMTFEYNNKVYLSPVFNS